jgi:hypothetical protein
MARILVGGFDQPTAAVLALQFQARRHDVWIFEGIDGCDRHITEHGMEVDLVVVDGTASPNQVESCFRNIAKRCPNREPRAMLLCVTRVYHGPRFEINLENEGARLVYVH